MNLFLAYSAGGDTIVKFPRDKAYPLGGSVNYFKYFMLQTHLKNKDGSLGINVQSGLTLYTTKIYRPIEFGVLTVIKKKSIFVRLKWFP